MADLKIPVLNKRSEKYFFKKKLTLHRKSKRKLIKESFIMLSLGLLIIYLNYLIPNKPSIFNNFPNNLSKIINNILDSFSYVYEIVLVAVVIISLVIASVLILGSFYRAIKVAKRKTRGPKFK